MDAIRTLIVTRLEELGMDMAELSRQLGKNHAYIQQYVKRKVPEKLPEDVRRQVARKLGLPETDLGAPADRNVDDDMPRDGIFEIDVRAGLGGGGYAEAVQRDGDSADPVKDETWRFPRSFMRNEVRAPESRVIMVETQGDSMFPTLLSGDRVIVDTGHKVPTPDGIYALRDRFGGIVVKRLQVMRRGDPPIIKVISDNPSHSAEDVGSDEIEIVGRVIFGLKRF